MQRDGEQSGVGLKSGEPKWVSKKSSGVWAERGVWGRGAGMEQWGGVREIGLSE